MDDQVDFEDLIDVNHFLVSMSEQIENGSQSSSQEHVTDTLDKMCEAMGEGIDHILKGEPDFNEMPDVVDLDEFERILAATYIYKEDEESIDTRADTHNIANVEQEEIINNVTPYEVPIKFEKINPTLTESFNDLDEDKQLTSFLDYVEEKDTKAIDDFEDFETIEISDDSNDAVKPPNYLENKNTNDLADFIDINLNFADDTLDSDDGYNSSDFEFITENEARRAGIGKYEKAIVIPNEDVDTNNNRPSASKPRKNEASHSDYVKYSKYKFLRCYAHSSAENHVIPEGEQYLDLFRGEFSPVIINNLYTLKNKSVLPAKAMAVHIDDLGFKIVDNMEEDNEEFKEEAEEGMKHILATYPGANKRKRRRF